MIRAMLPEPIGRRFGIVAKALLALAKGFLSPLAVLDVGGRPVPFDDVVRFVAQWHALEQKQAISPIKARDPGLKPACRTGRAYCAPLHQHALLVVRMKS